MHIYYLDRINLSIHIIKKICIYKYLKTAMRQEDSCDD